jgi:hypothetical protein
MVGSEGFVRFSGMGDWEDRGEEMEVRDESSRRWERARGAVAGRNGLG